ncbi:WD repeat domain-containing protein 83 [Escovopsis weberi]|uniref:WD repeat domain-containing protein 83 n=1 Tax=Escovopsis weberi TaxID=150374 RepID=A0A0M8MUN8_ESCWE|nr:WD repeat domain-containing protein 83 [Escovopsis weberi]
MAFPYKPAAHLLGSNGPIHAVAYSASPGTYILTGSGDRSIRLYNPFPSTPAPEAASARGAPKPAIPQGRLIQTYAAHGYEVLCLAVALDNETFVSGGGDRAVFLWDVGSATTLRRLGGHAGRVNSVAFGGPGDALIASGGFDTTVRLWDARSRDARPVQVLSEARDAVTSVAVRGAEVLAGSVDGRVRAYDVRAGRCTTDVLGASVVSLAPTRDARAVLVGTLDSRVRLMDRESGACLRAYGTGGAEAESTSTSTGTGTTRARENRDLRVQAVMGGGEKYVLAGDEVGGEDGDGRLWVWDLLSGKVVDTLRVPWGPPGHDRRRMVAIGQDGERRARSNVLSCMAWRGDGWGDQFCVGGTSGVVTVFEA